MLMTPKITLAYILPHVPQKQQINKLIKYVHAMMLFVSTQSPTYGLVNSCYWSQENPDTEYFEIL